MLAKREILNEPVVKLGGHVIKPYLVGDAGYTPEPFNVIQYSGWYLTKNCTMAHLSHASISCFSYRKFQNPSMLHVIACRKNHRYVILQICDKTLS